MKSGKSTLARALSETYDIPVSPLAEPIKKAAKVLGDPDPYGNGKLRWMQQGIGVLCTNQDTNFFVDLWFQDHPDFQETGAIVDDIRRPPEFEAFRSRNFIMVRLDVSVETQIARDAVPGPVGLVGWSRLFHSTEVGLDHLEKSDWNIYLSEDTTVPQRLAHITRMVDSLTPGSPTPGWGTYLAYYEGLYDASGNRLDQILS